MMILSQLFWEFFQIGAFAVGGGMATLPFLETLSEKTGWFTLEQLANMVAISESTPGPIGINMSTYVGFTTAGIPGAIIATLGVVLPSILLILIIAKFLTAFRDSRVVKAIFYALRPASIGLIAAAGFSVLKMALLNIPQYEATGKLLDVVQWQGVLLAVALYFAMKQWKKVHPVVFIAFSAVIGAVFSFAGM